MTDDPTQYPTGRKGWSEEEEKEEGVRVRRKRWRREGWSEEEEKEEEGVEALLSLSQGNLVLPQNCT